MGTKGISATEATIPAGQAEVKLPLKADADVRGSARPSHRSTVSGSATRPTSFTPDARITANTWTTSA